MKKLSKIKLQNAVVLENSEMKKIYGGSGTGTCAYSTSTSGVALCLEYGGAEGAEHMAGVSGWWCCNCAEAHSACN